MTHFRLSTLLSILLLAAAGSAMASAVVIKTASGDVEGLNQNDVSVFKGIPYAATTAGTNRWRAPQAVEAWGGVRQALDWGPICPQPVRRPFPDGVHIGEDCLNLNLWVPQSTEAKTPLPVMVWVHGGGYTHGSGSIHKIFTAGPMPANDFTAFVKNGVIMVTMNYRMGIFGVFGHPDIIAPDENGGRANFGMMDVIAALRWVQDNIAFFGGDPENVTLFGQSAGGGYVSALLASPMAAGLFNKAIVQSGAGVMADGRYLAKDTPFKESLESLSVKIVDSLAIDKSGDITSAVKALPYEDLLAATARTGLMAPVVDGVLLPEPVGEAFRNGHQADIPLLIGANSGEGSALAGMPGYIEKIVEAVPEDIVSKFYGDVDEQQRPVVVAGDALFVAPSSYVARASAMQSNSPTYLYHFSYVPEALAGSRFGASHGDEMAYVFANLKWRDGVDQATAYDRQLSKTLGAYWTNFARRGSPNGVGLPLWPAQTKNDDLLMRFDTQVVAEPQPFAQRMQAFGELINQQLDVTVSSSETGQEEGFNPFGNSAVDWAPPAPLIINIPARESLSLNGDWMTIIDKLNRGGSWGSFHQNLKPVTGRELIEYGFSPKNTLEVPGDWNTQDDRLLFYSGSVWYQRPFEFSPKAGRRYFLHFGGANFRADVSLNGQILGRHQGGYTPFNFEVTDQLHDGDNVLIAQVDNSLDKSSIPTDKVDWWHYGGLTRDVALVSVPETFIRQYKVYLADREAQQIGGFVQLDKPEAGIEVSLSIPELKVNKTVATDDNGSAAFSMNVKALDLWSPGNPKLYDVQLAAATDTVNDRIGFRSIETAGDEILLNGEPIMLKGISVHEETILGQGVANSVDDARATLELVKALGANFARLAHYPHNNYMARLADEMGLLLWEEVPVYWGIDWENEQTYAVASTQIRELVTRDINRASVVIWSLANETPPSPARQKFLSRMADEVRSLDQSRLISAALFGGGGPEFQDILLRIASLALADEGLDAASKASVQEWLASTGATSDTQSNMTINLHDPLGEILDVIGYNEYFGWYYAPGFAQIMGLPLGYVRETILEMLPDIRIRNNFGKPIIISEFGAGAKRSLRSADATIWSEDYQALVYAAQVKMISSNSMIKGLAPWILKDFRSHYRTLPGIQDFYNRKGIVDENGQPKEAFSVLQAFYRSGD
jgi:beta-glucuronidase